MSTTPYDQFDAAKKDTFWANSEGVVIPHQTNETIGIYDFMVIHSGWANGKLLAPEFANKTSFFTLGFTVCTFPGDGPNTIIETIVNWRVNSRTFFFQTQDCPIMTYVRANGNATIGSDGILSLGHNSRIYDSAIAARAYVDEWQFHLSLLAPSTFEAAFTSTATVYTSYSSIANAASTSTASASSGSTSLQSGANTISRSRITNLSDLPSILASWSSEQTTLTSSGPQVSDVPVDASSQPGENYGMVIGGASAGAVLFIILLVSIWLWRRRIRVEMDRESSLSHGPFIPYKMPTPSQDHQRKSETPLSKIQKEGGKSHSIPMTIIDTPDSTPPVSSTMPHSSAISGILSHRHPPSTVIRAAPPAYYPHPNVNQAQSYITTEDEPGPFLIGDLLGEWAEENRDALPYHLESRLRGGGYILGTHPGSISPEVWLRRFAVTRWELAGLVELFERTSGMPNRTSTSTTE